MLAYSTTAVSNPTLHRPYFPCPQLLVRFCICLNANNIHETTYIKLIIVRSYAHTLKHYLEYVKHVNKIA